jgi:ABC-2 type transport system permease protein
MAGDIRQLFRLYALYGRMDLNWFLQDMVTCVIVMASELIANVASVAGILLLSVRFGGVGGLSADEVLFMLGFFQLADGFAYMMFGGGNVLAISRRAGRGQVDHMLIQPRPLWMQLMGEGFMPVSGSSGFLMGIAVTWIACARLGISVTPAWFMAFAFYVACHAAIKIGLGYLSGSAAFYRPVACEELSAQVLNMVNLLGKYPLAGLPLWATAALTTVLPAGLMAYIPSLALLGRLEKRPHLALPLAVAAALLSAATYFFRRGLRYYAEYGCNRYRDIGHRN